MERLHCIRCYVGIETDADQGLTTLQPLGAARSTTGRPSSSSRELDLYTCFNMLLFDPDTTLESARGQPRVHGGARATSRSTSGASSCTRARRCSHRMQQEGRARGD